MNITGISYTPAYQNKSVALKEQPKAYMQRQIVYFTGNKSDASADVKCILNVAESISKENLLNHVRQLTDPKTEGRRPGSKGIEVARDYIADNFKKLGLKSFGENGYFQTVEVPRTVVLLTKENCYTHGQIDHDMERKHDFIDTHNVLGMIKGSEKPDEYVVVCAHYDHLGKNGDIVFPGADDNASGIACMLETARIMAEKSPPKKSVIFAALTQEEYHHRGADLFVSSLIKENLFDKVEVINFDMLAGTGGKVMDVWKGPNGKSDKLLESLEKAANALNVELRVSSEKDHSTDAKTFNDFKIPVVNLTWDMSEVKKPAEKPFHESASGVLIEKKDKLQMIYHPAFHTAEDTLENIDPKIFYEASRIAAASSYLLANNTNFK